jgi:hypothetical protein
LERGDPQLDGSKGRRPSGSIGDARGILRPLSGSARGEVGVQEEGNLATSTRRDGHEGDTLGDPGVSGSVGSIGLRSVGCVSVCVSSRGGPETLCVS